ncbi:unnamed protein product [Choristocarpus tenellus]
MSSSMATNNCFDEEKVSKDNVFQVVVTGGSKGIGRACVDAFARRGHRVLFTFCSDADAASSLECSYESGLVQGCQLDQGDFNSVRLFASHVEEWRGGKTVAVLINNAALGVATVSQYEGNSGNGRDATSEQDEDWRRAEEDMALMRVNALGPVWVTESLLSMMTPTISDDTSSGFLAKPGRSTVLFIGSVGGGSQAVFPGFRVADAMSKAALAYASKHFAARNIHRECVNFLSLCPGATLTDMFRASTLSKLAMPELLVDTLPQGSLLQPEEIAEAVWWLCTCPAARIFHGGILDASAGLAVRPGLLTEFNGS